MQLLGFRIQKIITVFNVSSLTLKVVNKSTRKVAKIGNPAYIKLLVINDNLLHLN